MSTCKSLANVPRQQSAKSMPKLIPARMVGNARRHRRRRRHYGRNRSNVCRGVAGSLGEEPAARHRVALCACAVGLEAVYGVLRVHACTFAYIHGSTFESEDEHACANAGRISGPRTRFCWGAALTSTCGYAVMLCGAGVPSMVAIGSTVPQERAARGAVFLRKGSGRSIA
jgi:hypothetical protein